MVYCKNCKHILIVENYSTSGINYYIDYCKKNIRCEIDTYLEHKIYYEKCEIINENNDCKNFEDRKK